MGGKLEGGLKREKNTKMYGIVMYKEKAEGESNQLPWNEMKSISLIWFNRIEDLVEEK